MNLIMREGGGHCCTEGSTAGTCMQACKNVGRSSFGGISGNVLSICGQPPSSNELINMYFTLTAF